MGNFIRKNAKKISLIISLALIMMCLSPLCEVNAAKSKNTKNSKEVTGATKTVTSLLKATRSYDVKKMKAATKKNPLTYITDANLVKVIKKSNKTNFEYRIKSVKVKGNSATAKVEVTYYDSADDLENGYIDSVRWNYKNKKATQKTLMKKWASFYETRYKSAMNGKKMKSSLPLLKARYDDDEDDYDDEDDEEDEDEDEDEDDEDEDEDDEDEDEDDEDEDEYEYDEDDDYDDDYDDEDEEDDDDYVRLTIKTATIGLKKTGGKWYVVTADKTFKEAVNSGTTAKYAYILKNKAKYKKKYYKK